nr:hypothetical protein [Tanacetum cinerariifolium]
MNQAPPSPDYIPGLEEPEQAPPSPDYVPCPEHADDEIVAEDQPYAEDASPITLSPEYVLESDFEAHPEDDDNEDHKEDPVDYLSDEGDYDDDEEEYEVGESSSAAAARPARGFRADYGFIATMNKEIMRDPERNESDLVHGEVMSLRTTVLSQMSEIIELQVADRRRQTVISELLRIDHRRSTEISELRTSL